MHQHIEHNGDPNVLELRCLRYALYFVVVEACHGALECRAQGDVGYDISGVYVPLTTFVPWV